MTSWTLAVSQMPNVERLNWPTCGGFSGGALDAGWIDNSCRLGGVLSSSCGPAANVLSHVYGSFDQWCAQG